VINAAIQPTADAVDAFCSDYSSLEYVIYLYCSLNLAIQGSKIRWDFDFLWWYYRHFMLGRPKLINSLYGKQSTDLIFFTHNVLTASIIPRQDKLLHLCPLFMALVLCLLALLTSKTDDVRGGDIVARDLSIRAINLQNALHNFKIVHAQLANF